MKLIVTLLFSLFIFSAEAQTNITGTITDKAKNPITGANVYIEGTYDGGSTDEQGNFSFSTTETGTQTLVIAFISFETRRITAPVSDMQNMVATLKEDVNSLKSVSLNTGSFASGSSKDAVLSAMDIYTTAGANGDVFGALKVLPGTSNVSEDGRLFVRGGTANETNIYIDGQEVFQPFLATSGNLPTRGRYSPSLFEGTNFSTGGYSAEYGNALSSVLVLNTIDEPVKEKTELQFLNVGLGGGSTKKWDKNSLSVNAFYINLKPYQTLMPERVDWIKPFESISGETVYRHKFKNGLLKAYTALSYSNFNLIQEDINTPNGVNVEIKNTNLYANASYKGKLGKDWKVFSGASFANDLNKVSFGSFDADNTVSNSHFKLKFKKRFSNYFKLNFGAEQYLGNFHETAKEPSFGSFNSAFKNNISSAFAEANLFFSKNLATQIGIRGDHNYLLNKTMLSPRISLAYKVSENSQMSLAYGDFYQDPEQDVLKYNSHLNPEKASHYILNYQYKNDGLFFRAEAYQKDYSNLIKFDTEMPEFNSVFNNNGSGYARGLDVFWQDKKSIKNLEYWASYSYIDTKRNFENYPTEATPNFVAKHNFSLVTKYWNTKWKSLISATFSLNSGRPYNNPNENEFQNSFTKNFTSLDLSWAYLISQQKILYISASNVLDSNNVFGYQYSNTPNPAGEFSRRTIRPNVDQFIVVGFFWTISKDKNDNQLKNL